MCPALCLITPSLLTWPHRLQLSCCCRQKAGSQAIIKVSSSLIVRRVCPFLSFKTGNWLKAVTTISSFPFPTSTDLSYFSLVSYSGLLLVSQGWSPFLMIYSRAGHLLKEIPPLAETFWNGICYVLHSESCPKSVRLIFYMRAYKHNFFQEFLFLFCLFLVSEW